MKTYPSIPYPGRKGVGERLHTFAKLDGSNLRFEWSKKRGWHRFGTRKRLIDASTELFGEAIPLFMGTLADPIGRIATDKKWQSVIVFCEFWGAETLGGWHVEGDPKHLTVIDVNTYKKGFLLPTEFLKLFGRYGPNYLGYFTWSPGFLQQLQDGEIEDAGFEGVVGKGTKGKKIIRYKYKTQAWKDAVLARHGEELGRRIINS